VRPAIFDSESPERTRYSSPEKPSDPPADAVAGARGAGAAASLVSAAALRSAALRSRASTRAASRCSRADGGRPAAGGKGAGAGGAAEITGDVVVPGAGVAPARIVAGGSNSKVYSRTRRPVAHEISRMTSTNGSWTPRSLTRRTNRRPSARFSNDARVLGNTGL
jgi:hypothetical protein